MLEKLRRDSVCRVRYKQKYTPVAITRCSFNGGSCWFKIESINPIESTLYRKEHRLRIAIGWFSFLTVKLYQFFKAYTFETVYVTKEKNFRDTE